MKKLSLLLLPMLLLTGCSSETETATDMGPTAPSEDTALATAEFVRTGIQEGRPQVLWHALPESYQNDVNGLVQQFAENMDADVWEQSMGIVKTIHSILVDKAEFFAGNPMVAGNEQMKEGIPMMGEMLGTIIDGMGDLEKLKSFDGATFLATSGSDLMKNMDKLNALSPGEESPLAAFYSTKIETVEETETTATLRMTEEDGTTKEANFVKHEGKWLPLDLVNDWDKNMQEAREALTAMPEQMQGAKMQVTMASAMITGALTPLKDAATQEQFDNALQGIAGQLMPMMGGAMGGGMGGFPGMGGGMAPPNGMTPPNGMEPPPGFGAEDAPESLGDAPGGDGN